MGICQVAWTLHSSLKNGIKLLICSPIIQNISLWESNLYPTQHWTTTTLSVLSGIQSFQKLFKLWLEAFILRSVSLPTPKITKLYKNPLTDDETSIKGFFASPPFISKDHQGSFDSILELPWQCSGVVTFLSLTEGNNTSILNNGRIFCTNGKKSLSLNLFSPII